MEQVSFMTEARDGHLKYYVYRNRIVLRDKDGNCMTSVMDGDPVHIIFSDDEAFVCISCLAADGVEAVVAKAEDLSHPILDIHTGCLHTCGQPSYATAYGLFILPTASRVWTLDPIQQTTQVLYQADHQDMIYSAVFDGKDCLVGLSHGEHPAILRITGSTAGTAGNNVTQMIDLHDAVAGVFPDMLERSPIQVQLCPCCDHSFSVLLSDIVSVSLICNMIMIENKPVQIRSFSVEHVGVTTSVLQSKKRDRILFSWMSFDMHGFSNGVSVYDAVTSGLLCRRETKNQCTARFAGDSNTQMMIFELGEAPYAATVSSS